MNLYHLGTGIQYATEMASNVQLSSLWRRGDKVPEKLCSLHRMGKQSLAIRQEFFLTELYMPQAVLKQKKLINTVG